MHQFKASTPPPLLRQTPRKFFEVVFFHGKKVLLLKHGPWGKIVSPAPGEYFKRSSKALPVKNVEKCQVLNTLQKSNPNSTFGCLSNYSLVIPSDMNEQYHTFETDFVTGKLQLS